MDLGLGGRGGVTNNFFLGGGVQSRLKLGGSKGMPPARRLQFRDIHA